VSIYQGRVGSGHLRAAYALPNLASAAARASGWTPGGSAAGAVVVRCRAPTCSDLQPGDWVVTHGGNKVKDAAHLRELSKATKPGKKVTVGVVRQGKKLNVTVGGGDFVRGGDGSAELLEG
jgi:S1-C subfamily serine protease